MVRAGYNQVPQWDWEEEFQVSTTVRKLKRTKYKKVRTGKLFLIKGGVCVFIYALVLVFLCIKSATLGYEIVDLKNEINSLDTGNKRIEYKLARIRNLENIEKVAIQELGMYKPEEHLTVAAVQTTIESETAASPGPVAVNSEAGKAPLQKIYAGLVQLAEHNQ